jgi:hypothetical protein
MVTAIAREHPGMHPYTLSLLLQVRFGRVVVGQEVARILAERSPIQTPTR